MNSIPYELLENHIAVDCPRRPLICQNLCGDYKFPDPIEDTMTSAYICENCFVGAYGPETYHSNTDTTLGNSFKKIWNRQNKQEDSKQHSVP